MAGERSGPKEELGRAAGAVDDFLVERSAGEVAPGHGAAGHGHHAGEPRPGWGRPKPEHIPRPTYWPATLALGLTFAAWGLVTTPWISLVGLLLFGIALAGWIGELRHDP